MLNVLPKHVLSLWSLFLSERTEIQEEEVTSSRSQSLWMLKQIWQLRSLSAVKYSLCYTSHFNSLRTGNRNFLGLREIVWLIQGEDRRRITRKVTGIRKGFLDSENITARENKQKTKEKQQWSGSLEKSVKGLGEQRTNWSPSQCLSSPQRFKDIDWPFPFSWGWQWGVGSESMWGSQLWIQLY